MTFWKTVGAYLTGWVIAQTVWQTIGRKVWDTKKGDWALEVAEKVERRLSDHANVRARYPYADGDHFVLGPDVYASRVRDVITWQGEDYFARGGMATERTP